MRMKWNLVTKHMRPHMQLQEKLQQKILKMETHLGHFPQDAVHLQVNLARHPKKEWFTAALTLSLPTSILRAEKTGTDPVPAFDQAVRALLREVTVLKSTLRREDQWQRNASRTFAHVIPANAAAQLSPQA